MSTTGRVLTKTDIYQLLQEVGTELAAQNKHVSIYLVGGAAIALTLNDTRTTTDLDAMVINNDAAFREAVKKVTEKHGLENTWISDDITDFLSRDPIGQEPILQFPGLLVTIGSPEHLLAMKLRASIGRSERDRSDVLFLSAHLGLTTAKEIADLTERQFQGFYADRYGYDEYLDTAEFILLEDQLLRQQQQQTAQLEKPQPNIPTTQQSLPATSPETSPITKNIPQYTEPHIWSDEPSDDDQFGPW